MGMRRNKHFLGRPPSKIEIQKWTGSSRQMVQPHLSREGYGHCYQQGIAHRISCDLREDDVRGMIALRRITIIGLLFLLVLSSLPFQIEVTEVAAESGSPGDGIAEIDVPVRGTYLHTEEYQGGVGMIESPAMVDLQAFGFLPGDNICISFKGEVCNDAGWDSRPLVYRDVTGLIGVFSMNSQLLSVGEEHRVPGAIDGGMYDADTGTTHFNQEPTDIPEDFSIKPKTGSWIEVPRNARFLFISQADSYFQDNKGSITVTIEKDTDGDGLPDSWEIYGIDLDKDGTVDLDLPMLGADSEHKDVFVEADYYTGRRPIPEAIEDVKDAFANAPVSNPDGVNGINLHVVIDESLPAIGIMESFEGLYLQKAINFGTPDERSNPKTLEAKELAFRYCLFVNKIWLNPPNYTCPGVAEGAPCDDFILAFGALENGGNRKSQAAVFMHELGHALGLEHGGDVEVNYKPNYLSIMNYAFQFNSWKPNRPLDYSHGNCWDLDESNLNENDGIGITEVTVWTGPDGLMYTNDGVDMRINWDNDNVTSEGVNINLNNQVRHPSPANEVLTDHDDWGNLVYRFRGTGLATRSATPEDYHVELTAEEIEQMYLEAEDIVGYQSPEPAEDDSGWLNVMILVVAVVGAMVVTGLGITVVWSLMRKRTNNLVEE